MQEPVPAVVRLRPRDAGRYVELRRRMLETAPWAFSASIDDDRGLDEQVMAERLAGPRSAVFAVERAGPEGAVRQPAPLGGAVGLVQASPSKFAHRCRIWGVFVDVDLRGKGLGRAMMEAALDQARRWPGVDYVDLGVSENAPAALALYEGLGFRIWGREPETTAYEGRRFDEIFMTMRL